MLRDFLIDHKGAIYKKILNKKKKIISFVSEIQTVTEDVLKAFHSFVL